MLRWSLIFLVIAVLSSVFGYTGITGGSSALLARYVLLVSMVLFFAFLLVGRNWQRKQFSGRPDKL